MKNNVIPIPTAGDTNYNTVTEWRDFGLPCKFCHWTIEHLHSVITDATGNQKLGMVTIRKEVFGETY